MLRLFLLLLAVLTAVPPAGAQPPPPPMSPEQARAALEMLNDPHKRAAVAALLQAIGQAHPPPAPAAEPAAKPADDTLALVPDSLGAQVLTAGSAFVHRIGARLATGLAELRDIGVVWRWVVSMLTDPDNVARLLDSLWRLALAFAGGYAVALGLRRLSRRPMARLDAALAALRVPPIPGTDTETEARAEIGDIDLPPAPTGWARLRAELRRLWLALGRFCLELPPLLGLLVVGHAFVGSPLGGAWETRLLIGALLMAYVGCDGLIRAERIILAPGTPAARLVPLGDAAANYLHQVGKHLLILGVGGYVLGEIALLLGRSYAAHDAMLRVVALLVTLRLAALIPRMRRPVARLLRARDGATGPATALRDRAAALWHWIALAVLAAPWLVWVAGVDISYAAALRSVALVALILGGARLVLMGTMSMIDRLVALDPRIAEHYPGLEDRLLLYRPVLTATLRFLVHAAAALLLLEVFGRDALVWLWATPAGQHILSGLATLALTVLVAVAVWEVINAAIHRHLMRLQQDAQIARSARLRTLLPLLRTALLVAISIVAVLMILSEIGVNIAPLLAGAGILGVAIGFGSQKLVQDLITGIFLLLENALQVGDVVNVASLTGKVEGLSVRTIRLRAADGSVHIIPFSSVGTVTNLSRGVGNAEVRVTLDFSADPDEVAEVLRAIVTEMRAEAEFEARITADFQLFGVDHIDACGVTVTGQVACTDSGRWSVQREINRRIKQRFHARGIRFFNQPAAEMG